MDFVSFNFQGKHRFIGNVDEGDYACCLTGVQFRWRTDSFEPDEEYLQEFDRRSAFPEKWKSFRSFVGNSLLVTRHSRDICVRLRNFFLFNKMEFPKIDILDVRKYLTNAKYISSNEQSYEMISEATGITVPDMDNILERAWFIGNVLAKCWSKKALKHVAPADFSEPEKLMTHYKKEGAPPVSHVSVAELQSRPLDTRFTGTYVVFTGELKTSKHPKMLRTKARAIVAQLGGITNDSIDGHVTHLVTGVQTAGREKSQKEKQAEKDGIILITAAEFFELIED